MKQQRHKTAGTVRWIIGTRGVTPKLGARLNEDGKTESLFLEYYHGGGKRYRETLKGLKLVVSPNPIERAGNADALTRAKAMQASRQNDLLNTEGYKVVKRAEEVNLWECITAEVEQTENRNLKAAAAKLMGVCKSNYPRLSTRLTETQLTRAVVNDFIAELEAGEASTAKRYYSAIRSFFERMQERGVIHSNPLQCAKVAKKVSETPIEKQILTIEELKKMAAVNIPTLSEEVKRAFLFCCFTGVRGCDARALTYRNIDLKANGGEGRLIFEQCKVAGRSSSANVSNPLGAAAQFLKPQGKQPNTARLFNLPTREACNMQLKVWAAAAGVTKNISWHCSRHTFAVLTLMGGADIFTTSKLLGHSSVTMTQKYLHVVEDAKSRAVSIFPILTSGEQGGGEK